MLARRNRSYSYISSLMMVNHCIFRKTIRVTKSIFQQFLITTVDYKISRTVIGYHIARWKNTRPLLNGWEKSSTFKNFSTILNFSRSNSIPICTALISCFFICQEKMNWNCVENIENVISHSSNFFYSLVYNRREDSDTNFAYDINIEIRRTLEQNVRV